MISPAVSLTRGGLFREAVQSGTVRCRLLAFELRLLLNILNATSSEHHLKDGRGLLII